MIQIREKCQKCFSRKSLLKVQAVRTHKTVTRIRTAFKLKIKETQQVGSIIFHIFTKNLQVQLKAKKISVMFPSAIKVCEKLCIPRHYTQPCRIKDFHWYLWVKQKKQVTVILRIVYVFSRIQKIQRSWKITWTEVARRTQKMATTCRRHSSALAQHPVVRSRNITMRYTQFFSKRMA